MKRSELKEMIKASMLEEAKEVKVKDDETVDVDIEKEVDIDDESTESDIEVDTMMPGESETEQEIQGLLMKAQEEAAKLGDEKLTDQIGNTITYFTRAHISQVDEAEDYNSDVADISMDNPAEDAEVGFALEESLRFKKLAGIITEGEYKSRLAEGRLHLSESIQLKDIMQGGKIKKGVMLNPSVAYKDLTAVDEQKFEAIEIETTPGTEKYPNASYRLVGKRVFDGKEVSYSIDSTDGKMGDEIADLITNEEAIKRANS